MATPVFHFREFSVRQNRAAMKVCTDACVFGAWVARRLTPATNALDIGTGTGLLTLLLAQQSDIPFTAIEVDPGAWAEAADNFAASPWNSRINLFRGDVRSFAFPKKYDFIIANPPFHEGQLRSPDPARSRALHDNSLTLVELLTVIDTVLNDTGRFAVHLPFARRDFFAAAAASAGFHLLEEAQQRQTEKHAPFRIMMLYSRAPGPPGDASRPPVLSAPTIPAIGSIATSPVADIVLRDEKGEETPTLLEWMKPYYIRPYSSR